MNAEDLSDKDQVESNGQIQESGQENSKDSQLNDDCADSQPEQVMVKVEANNQQNSDEFSSIEFMKKLETIGEIKYD